MQTTTRVAKWFPITHNTFIRVFRSFKAPHTLPEFITDKILLQEVCYQMTSGFSKVHTKGKKNPWPTLPLTIGTFTVRDFKEVEVEAEETKGFHFPPLAHRSYGPERIIPAHWKRAKLKWKYQHIEWPIEEQTKNWYKKDREAAPEESTDQEGQDDQTP